MSLRQAAVTGAMWTSSSIVVVTVLQLLQITLLARILDPADFGLMALVLVVYGFVQAFVDMGVGNAVIHHKDLDKRHLSSVYWLNVLVGLALFLLVAGTAPLLALFFEDARLAGLLRLTAVGFLIVPIGQLFQVLLQRELRFDALAKVEVASAVAGIVVAVGTALSGAGAYALVWGMLASALVRAVLVARVGLRTWRPEWRLRFSRELAPVFSFGMYQMGQRSVNYFSGRLDYLVLGKFFGAETLGAYSLAYQLVLMPLERINPIVNRVAFPIFAKKQGDDAALRQGYMEVAKVLSLASFPLLVGAAVLSSLLIPVVFGDKWGLAVQLLPLLAFVGLFKGLTNPSGSVMMAKGRADVGFKWNLVVAAVNLVVFLVTVRFGVFVFSGVFVVLTAIYFLAMLRILHGLVGLRTGDYLAAVARAAVPTLVMGLVVGGLYALLRGAVPPAPLLGLLVATGALAYGACLLAFERAYLKDLLRLVRASREAKA